MAFGYFFPGTEPDSANVNFALRQKIAMAMLSAKKGYPKTLGEGLSAIGDALGDRGMMRQLEALDQQKQQEIMNGPMSQTAPQAAAASAPADFNSATNQAQASEPPVRAEATQQPDNLYTAPSQPSSVLASNMPAGLTAPQATLRDLGPPGQAAQGAGAGAPAAASPSPAAPTDEEAGGYNVIDAQAGTKMKQSPEYVRAAIARATKNPDMQAYLGNLAAKEAPRPGVVSRTGARGPFQFIPSTAAQYGLTDPNNTDASAQAALQLTTDNAAQFEKRFGRPPTMAELAVLHQQGAGGGGNLMAGRGTDPNNLVVNNIAANASPQAAVAKINNYYGMPDRAVDPRAGVAQAMMAQNGGQAPRVMNADDSAPQQVSFNAQNQLPMPAQQAALPPVQQQVAPQAAPPQQAAAPLQVAQAPQGQPQAIPGYVTPTPGTPRAPPQIQPSREELGLQQYVNRLSMTNPYAGSSPEAMALARMQADRAAAQKVQDKIFDNNLKIQQDLTRVGAEQRGSQVERQNADLKAQEEIRKMRMENHVLQDFGGLPPEKVFDKADKSSTEAKTARDGLIALNNARSAILSGAILGPNADFRLGVAKINHLMFGKADAGSAAANTEVFRSSMAPAIAAMLASTVGRTQVSNTDRDFAAAAAGGQITLEPTTIKRLIDITGRLARDKVEYNNSMVEMFGKNNPQFREMFSVPIPEDVKGIGRSLLSDAEKTKIDEAENWLLNNPRDPMAPKVRRSLGYK